VELPPPIAQGARTKRLADKFFQSDRLLELSMLLLGRRRMGRAIRCEPLILPSRRARVHDAELGATPTGKGPETTRTPR